MRSNPQIKCNRFTSQYVSLSNTHSFVTSQKSMIPMRSNPPIKNQSLQFPIRIPFQYAFLCHFAEVYSVNALKSPIKDQSIPFPTRIPFQYAFICHFAEVYYTNAIRSPNKDLSLHFTMRIPLSLRRSLTHRCTQILK
jgi:hypothetical protein